MIKKLKFQQSNIVENFKINTPKIGISALRGRSTCNETSIENRVDTSDVILSATCEVFSRTDSTSDRIGACTRANVWRIMKGNHLAEQVKGYSKVNTI